MKKQKFSLRDLKVSSFNTSVQSDLKAGAQPFSFKTNCAKYTMCVAHCLADGEAPMN
ncbi:MAG: hypothetical protein WBB45_13080 [Cyclobacteriaceae bacterium]